MRNMNILFITHNNNEKSGANRSLLSLIDLFKKENNAIVLVNKTDGNLPKKLKEMGVKTINTNYWWSCVPIRKPLIRRAAVVMRGYARIIGNIIAIIRLLETIKQYKIDCVYTNTSVVTFSIEAARIAKIKHIWHLREFGKKDFDFCRLIPRALVKKDIEYGIVIAVSNSINEYYSKEYKTDNITTVYNGLNVSKYKFEFKKRDANVLNVLIIGQISNKKGQGQAIRAVVKINEERDVGCEVNLYIAGKGDTEYLNGELEKASSPNYIHVLGQVDDVSELRSRMHICVVCSRAEAFGRVTLEAMLSGLPVIGANCAGTAELIEDGKTGLLYEYNNIEQLANKIMILLDDDKRMQIAHEARQYAQSFTIQRTFNAISNILNH